MVCIAIYKKMAGYHQRLFTEEIDVLVIKAVGDKNRVAIGCRSDSFLDRGIIGRNVDDLRFTTQVKNEKRKIKNQK